jgi:uncharacterized protein (DUF58 family)
MKWLAFAGAWLTALAFALYQGGVTAWHLLGFVFALTLLTFLLSLAPLHALHTDRMVRPGPYYAGDTLRVTLVITSPRRRLWPYLVVEEDLSDAWGVSHPRFVMRQLEAGATRLEYRIPSLKRGAYTWESVVVTTGDPIGLIRRSRTLPVPGRLVVWPRTISLGSTRLWSRRWSGENPARQLSRQESTHVRGVREYITGDRLSHVHWRTSAHTGDFKVKQFEPETEPDFTIVLDYSAGFTEATWETAVSAAASLAQHANRSRQAIGLLVLDTPERQLAAASGSAALGALMDTLSESAWKAESNRSREPRLGGRVVAVCPAGRAGAWQNRAEIVVPIGLGGLETLEDLPAWVRHVPSRHEAVR